VSVGDGAYADSGRTTQRVAAAFQWASAQGRKNGARTVDAMHVLLGLANSEDSVAGRALQRLGVTMAQVRESAETWSMTGRTGDDSSIDADVVPGHIDDNGNDSLELGMDMAPRLRQIIRLAIDV